MQYKAFFILCALQAMRSVSAQWGRGLIAGTATACNNGYRHGYSGYSGLYPGGFGNNLGYAYDNGNWNSNCYSGVSGCHNGYRGHATRGYNTGNIEAAGTLRVRGPVAVDGRVPVEGSVNYAGDVRATGTACAACGCGNIRRY